MPDEVDRCRSGHWLITSSTGDVIRKSFLLAAV